MRRPRPVWQAFLYLNRSRTGRRVAVQVFASQADMQAWHRAWRREHRQRVRTGAIGTDTQGMASWFGRQVPGFKPRVQGVVYLNALHAGGGVVSHELTHIALFVGERRKGESVHAWHERVAWLQGWLVTQYWRAWYRNGPDGGAD